MEANGTRVDLENGSTNLSHDGKKEHRKMDDRKLVNLRKVMGEFHKLIYEAVKAGTVADFLRKTSFLHERCKNTCI